MPSKPDPDRLPHPGRTSAERRASDGVRWQDICHPSEPDI
jgi:hypothetical protein